MKDEQPVKVQPYETEGHKLERRIFNREIHETYCADDACEFKGQPAAQGVCHTQQPYAFHWESFIKVEKESEEELKSMRERAASTEEYIETLESQYICQQMNQWSTLDELVRLRAENRKLKNLQKPLP
jgi:hypothetical protein